MAVDLGDHVADPDARLRGGAVADRGNPRALASVLERDADVRVVDLLAAASEVVTFFTVSTPIAKPTPSLPPDSLAIWELTPITLPDASSSGRPSCRG